ncbi:Hydrolase acting on acid anhydrides to facilitate cellular and subcellular movement [Saitozyma sp. JCM 24511]|nr:Hydrolase acting on acid anhydrides to facilitate cellular and subcellular movement [Saitozyma sp. JCM 24511]
MEAWIMESSRGKPTSSSTPNRKSQPAYVDLVDSPDDPRPVAQTHNGSLRQQPAGSLWGPLGSSSAPNRPKPRTELLGSGSSKPPARPNTSTTSYSSYIKPATPGAFRQNVERVEPLAATRPSRPGYVDGWPTWVAPAPVKKVSPIAPPAIDDGTESFNIDVAITAADQAKHMGDADEHMRELLSGAIGDGEGDMGDDAVKEGEDAVEGFVESIRLMPHQVRGVRWMRGRETGRKYGGILADDMGLGKTVQALARIVEGVHTAPERKAGFKAGTLIVTPLAVMEQWAEEIRKKTAPGRLKVTTHHGPARTKIGKTLEKYDVVITTYQTLASEFGNPAGANTLTAADSDDDDTEPSGRARKPKAKAAGRALFDVKWLRVVLDEAQHIKNRNTKAAKAAVGLVAKYRWCLTGTPIQNNVDELYSLLHFLRAKPLDDWGVFKERISSLVKDGRTKLAMKRLHVVLRAVMLRRTKDATIDGKPILNLPGRLVKVVPCVFDAEERAFYDSLEQKTSLTFNKFLRNGTAMANYTSVLTMLLRLRQACDHPALVTASLAVDSDELKLAVDDADDLADLLGGLGVDKGKKCEMCYTTLQNGESKRCAECVPLANDPSNGDDDRPLESSKIRMLLKLLAEVETRSQRREKTIVFSQFTSFLNLVEPFLREAGVRFVRYDGSMRNDKRLDALESIRSNPEIRVILISFKAGSTGKSAEHGSTLTEGLNLTCCNNVILMDLWWNPALGQKLDVNIYKLTVEGTVEDRILTLQDNKRELAKAALSGEARQNVMKLTLNDIIDLFRPRPHQRDDDSDDSDD